MTALYLSLCFLMVLPCPWAAAQPSPPMSLSGCRDKCGNITVPYPFGFEPNCFREGFRLTCNENDNPPLVIYNLTASSGYYTEFTHVGRDCPSKQQYKVTDISTSGKIYVSYNTSSRCFFNSSDPHYNTSYSYKSFVNTPYLVSVNNSMFTLSCPGRLGYFTDGNGSYVTGCAAQCGDGASRTWQWDGDGDGGTCNRDGCSQTPIPRGVDVYRTRSVDLQNVTYDMSTTNKLAAVVCSFFFITDSNWFQYRDSYLSMNGDFEVQVVLDWAIRNPKSRRDAMLNKTSYACQSANSECSNSTNGPGYICNCKTGYQGNPYINGGCVGIF